MNFRKETNPKVILTMETGESVTIELFPEVAPITVANFLELVDKKFYDGLIFHRVIEGFMIQGGDPEGTGMGGSAKNIKGEFRLNGVLNPLPHTKGVISMARSSNPNSASSQFFIMHENAPHLDGNYAAFGIVVDNIALIDKIAVVPTNSQDKPLKDQRIKEIKRA